MRGLRAGSWETEYPLLSLSAFHDQEPFWSQALHNRLRLSPTHAGGYCQRGKRKAQFIGVMPAQAPIKIGRYCFPCSVSTAWVFNSAPVSSGRCSSINRSRVCISSQSSHATYAATASRAYPMNGIGMKTARWLHKELFPAPRPEIHGVSGLRLGCDRAPFEG